MNMFEQTQEQPKKTYAELTHADIPDVSYGSKIYETKVASVVNLDKIYLKQRGKCQWYTPKSKRKNGDSNNGNISSNNYNKSYASKPARSKNRYNGKRKNNNSNNNNNNNSKNSKNNNNNNNKRGTKNLKNGSIDDERMLKMKLRKPAGAKVLLSSNGMLTIIKCANVQKATEASKDIKLIVKQSGQTILEKEEHKVPRLKSITGSTKYDLGIIKLEGLEFDDDHYKRCRYAPELFPYLVYKYPYTVEVNRKIDTNTTDSNSGDNSKILKRKKYVTLIIFSDGRMLMKNGQTKEQLQKICNEMYHVLKKYAR